MYPGLYKAPRHQPRDVKRGKSWRGLTARNQRLELWQLHAWTFPHPPAFITTQKPFQLYVRLGYHSVAVAFTNTPGAVFLIHHNG